MKYDMTRPCDSCPFRKDIKFYLTRERKIEIIEGLKSGATFPCHKTTIHDDDDEHIPTSKESFCAGAMIMLEKAQDPEQAPHNQALRIMERLGFYDHSKLELTSPVFDDFEQMIERTE